MNFQLMNDRIAVRLDAAAQKSPGGIEYPQNMEADPFQRGEVVQVGPGLYSDALGKRLPLFVKVGDRVVVNEKQGVKVDLGREKFLIMNEPHVIAIMPATPIDKTK